MCDDVMIFYAKSALMTHEQHLSNLIPAIGEIPRFDKCYLASVHRAENTDDVNKTEQVSDAFDLFNQPVLFPVHSRTVGLIKKAFTEKNYSNIIFAKLMGYLDMLYFTIKATAVITDSGGLQKEAYMMKTP